MARNRASLTIPREDLHVSGILITLARVGRGSGEALCPCTDHADGKRPWIVQAAVDRTAEGRLGH